VKAALTHKADVAPQPTRRRRTEDTGRAAFKLAAGKMMRRAVRIPAEAFATATGYLADTLDWLNQWHQHDEEACDDVRASPSDHLYPHL
jgi:hypothetical protein